MKCDQFLPWLECGGPVRAALARRHARRCASCRAAAATLANVKSELAGDGRLPPGLRQAFLNAANRGEPPVDLDRSAAKPVRSSDRSLWWAALAASVVAAAGLLAWRLRPGDSEERQRESVAHAGKSDPKSQDNQIRRLSPIAVASIDPAAELAPIQSRLAALDATLDQLALEATRLAAQQALERVLADYQLAAR